MLNAVIIFMVCISCIPYYFKYEKKKPQTRESVVLAVMIALTVASRMLFAFSPGFKPVSAMVIICGMAFGRESGFLCGSLSAVVSNFFFGQGPWTPFQMLAWGMIGWLFVQICEISGINLSHKFSCLFTIFSLWINKRHPVQPCLFRVSVFFNIIPLFFHLFITFILFLKYSAC